jgi:uncharacterized membrane protein YhaH (DUF805 family)
MGAVGDKSKKGAVIMKLYLKVFKNYANFKGRASRREYWVFSLINALILLILFWLCNLLFTYSGELETGLLNTVLNVATIIFIFALIIFILGLIVPSYALFVRRVHDSGRSGWHAIPLLVMPINGFIINLFVNSEMDSLPQVILPLIFLLLQICCAIYSIYVVFAKSQPVTNAYGEYPIANTTH